MLLKLLGSNHKLLQNPKARISHPSTVHQLKRQAIVKEEKGDLFNVTTSGRGTTIAGFSDSPGLSLRY